MSTSYGVKCLDCDYGFDGWSHNDWKRPPQIVKDWPKYKVIFETIKSLDTYLFDVDMKFLGAEVHPNAIFEFLEEHYGHNLALLDEYDKTEPLEGYEPTTKPMGELFLDLKSNRLNIQVPPDRYEQLSKLLNLGE